MCLQPSPAKSPAGAFAPISWPHGDTMSSSDSDDSSGIRGFVAFASLIESVPDLRPWGDITKFRAPAWDDVRLQASEDVCAIV